MVGLSAGIVSNGILVLGNAPRSVRIDAVVRSGHHFEGNYARRMNHFEGIPCVLLCLKDVLRPRPLIFYNVLFVKMLLFFRIQSKMNSTGSLVVRSRVSFPCEFSLKGQYSTAVSQIST